MMIEEFYAIGGPAVSNEAYEKIEEVYVAYNRFDSKEKIASFCRKHGAEGIDALTEPLERYRAMKREDDDLQDRIAELQAKIDELNRCRKSLHSDMAILALQHDLSIHWCKCC